MNSKLRILSGIQPSGKLHIGNYLGALKNFVDLQNSGKFDCYFTIVDLHSLTEDYNPKEKTEQILDLATTYLAAGLDPKKSTIFLQSAVPAHTELTWVLSTITPMGEMERMTQYKDKAQRQAANINVGLFIYPVLMAADILLYNPPVVPVGDDQTQHLELTRELARRFNKRFGKTFVEPKPLYTRAPRVMSLSDPSRKMSKSEPAGCLFMDDSPAEIIKRAVTATDAGSGKMPAGVANLFLLLSHFGNEQDNQRFRDEYEEGSIKYSELKTLLSKRIADYFADYRKKKSALDKKLAQIHNVLKEGARRAGTTAQLTLDTVKKKIGLI
jgi:tryptophanyl-tRNA synthetase